MLRVRNLLQRKIQCLPRLQFCDWKRSSRALSSANFLQGPGSFLQAVYHGQCFPFGGHGLHGVVLRFFRLYGQTGSRPCTVALIRPTARSSRATSSRTLCRTSVFRGKRFLLRGLILLDQFHAAHFLQLPENAALVPLQRQKASSFSLKRWPLAYDPFKDDLFRLFYPALGLSFQFLPLGAAPHRHASGSHPPWRPARR